MIVENSIINKDQNIVCSLNDGKYVLVPIVNNIADMHVIHTLNEVGSFIWDQIDNIKTFDQILKSLVTEYVISEEIARKDLIAFLEELEKKRTVSFS